MITRVPIAVALALSLTLSSMSAHARTSVAPQAASGRIASVTATGSARYSSDAIVQITGLKPGDTITRDDMQRVADTLAQLGPFATVHYRFATTDQGVKIEYQLTDAPALPVMFDNFPWFTDDELIAELKKNSILFDGTEPASGAMLDQTALALEKILEQHAIFGSVTHALATIGPDTHEVMEFKLEGVQAQVERLEYSDPAVLRDRAIQDRLSDLVGKPFSRASIESFNFEQVRPEYLANGYLRVQFGPAKANLPAGTDKTHANKVDVVVPVNPGLSYVWSGVTWSGESAISAADLDKLNILNAGSVANGTEIAALWERVKTAYGNQGFLDMSLQPDPQYDDVRKLVSYTVTIQEGPQYHMGQLQLSGLSVEGERRIRAAWTTAAGAVFNESAYEAFLDKGIDRALMGFPAHYDKDKIERLLDKDPSKATVNVLLNFP